MSDDVRQARAKDIMVPAGVFAISLGLFVLSGFDGALIRDDAVYMYSGQRLAEGVPPYASIFDPRTPLASMLTGTGVMLARHAGVGDLLGARWLFCVLSALTVMAMYLLGRQLIGTRPAGLIAAFLLAGSWPFLRHAASGPGGKIPVVLFAVLAMLFMARRRWFLAGLCGSLAGLTWQPMGIYALAALPIAWIVAEERRRAAVLETLGGIILPVALVAGFFAWHGALRELLEGAVLFHVSSLSVDHPALLRRVVKPVITAYRSDTATFLPFAIGLVVTVYVYRWRSVASGSLVRALTSDPWAPWLLTLPAPVVWSLLDFQGSGDLYPFLPYVTVGFALMVHWGLRHLANAHPEVWRCGGRRIFGAGLVLAVMSLPTMQALEHRQGNDLAHQREAARYIADRCGPEGRLMTVGAPEVMVLLGRVNPSRYVFLIRGIDRWVDRTYPGGFTGWVGSLQQWRPDAVVLGMTTGPHAPELMAWLERDFTVEEAGEWRLYLRRQ